MRTSRDAQTFLGSGGAVNGGRVVDDYRAATSDATVKTMFRVRLAAGESVRVGASVVGNRSDATAAASRDFSGLFRRQAGGNVTLVGVLQGGATQTDGVTPAINLVANTTDQTVDLNVTGVAAQAWEWQAKVEYHKV